MSFRRRLAFAFTHLPQTMNPTRIDSTFDLQNPDERRRAPIIHLCREEEALVMHEATWVLLGPLAIADGGWEPLGTDAKPKVRRSDAFAPDLPAAGGHYLPDAQIVTGTDARALAAGIRRAMQTTEPDWLGGDPRRVPLTEHFADRWNEALVCAPVPSTARAWRVHDKAGQIAAWVERGAFRIIPGLPAKVLADDAERERLETLRREVARLEAELANDAAAKLAKARAELAGVGTNG